MLMVCPATFSSNMADVTTGICLSAKICIINLLLNLYIDGSLIKPGMMAQQVKNWHQWSQASRNYH